MKRLYATVSEQGEVVIPEDVRKLLGLQPHDAVAFTIEDNQVRLVRASMTLEEAYGSIEPQNRPEDWEEAIRIAKDERAERLLRKLQGP